MVRVEPLRGETRGTWARCVVLAAGVLVLGAPGASAAPSGEHEDARLGFSVRYPRGWTQVPVSGDEKWVAAKYLSDKTHFYTDKDVGDTTSFKPHMTVISFVHAVVKKRGVAVEEGEDGTPESISFNNPYLNYQDYMKRTYSGGGWFVNAEKSAEIKGVKVTQYEIKVEKLTYTGPKRIMTWVFHTDDVDLACHIEVLEDSYDKLKNEMLSCLKSFRIIPRTKGSLDDLDTSQTFKVDDKSDESELTLEERTALRKTSEEETHRKAQANLPSDWVVKEMGRFLVLNHADDKYARKVVAHAEAVWKWLDKTFAYIGPGEYVPRPILRICKDRDEENAMRSARTSWGNQIEIVTHEDKSAGAMSWELEYVNRALFGIWMSHRNRDLYWALPLWLDTGLAQVVGTARSKGSQLEFKVDDWERDGLRESAKKKELTSPRELVMLNRETFGENANRQKQSAAFIRFLLESRNKECRALLDGYLDNLQILVAEQLAKEKAEREAKEDSSEKGPETEAEEEEAFRKRREAYTAREKEFLTELFNRTFSAWTDKDWARVETLFFKSIG